MTAKQSAFLLSVALSGLLLVAGADTASAQTPNPWCAKEHNPKPAPPPDPDPRCSCGEKDGDGEKCQGSPCYLGSGVYSTSVLDLQVRVSAGWPLTVTRRYLSSQISDGPMGYGWMPSVVSRLSYATYQLAAGVYQKRAYILMPTGHRLVFTENSNGTFTAPAGRYDVLIKNTNGSFDLTLQHSRTHFYFGGAGYLTSIQDGYLNNQTYYYGTTPTRVQRITDFTGSGRYISISWGTDGRISAIGDSSGRSLEYVYDSLGSLQTSTDPIGRVTAYSYVSGRFGPLLTGISDAWSRPVAAATYFTTAEEPLTDRVKTYTELGETYTVAYNGGSVTETGASFPGSPQSYGIGDGGLVTSYPAVGGGRQVLYWPDGNVKMSTDAVGIKSYFEYDANGNVLTVTRNYQGAAGTPIVRFDYSYSTSWPSAITSITPKKPIPNTIPQQWQVDTDWMSWQVDYYLPGDSTPGALPGAVKAVRRMSTAGQLFKYEYDSKGHVTKFTDALGGTTNYTSYVYDSAGNLTSVTRPANNDTGTLPQTLLSYDGLGRVITTTDPLGRVTSFTWDAVDRITSVTLPTISTTSGSFTTTVTYDVFDAATSTVVTQVQDPSGLVSEYGYDQFDQLVRTWDAAGHVTAFAYNRGKLMSRTDANNYTTSYTYDVANRPTTITFPDHNLPNPSQAVLAYRADGKLQSVARGGQSITYTYDVFGRIKQRRNTSDASVHVDYTYVGQKLTEVDNVLSSSSTEIYTYGYDTFLRRTTETGPVGTVSYGWDSANRLTSYTAPGSPAVTGTYAYYGDNTLKSIAWSPITAGSFVFLYDLAGRRTRLTYPHGQRRDYSYDEQGRLTSVANKINGGQNFGTFQYGYDQDWGHPGTYTRKGLRTSLTTIIPSLSTSDGTHTYQYDDDFELTKWTTPTGAASTWQYDAVGNRTAASGTAYTYRKLGTNPLNWQQLTSGPPYGFSYDARGNVSQQTGGAAVNFTWDWQNRLTDMSGVASYTYDVDGKRLSKTVGTTTTSYLYQKMNILQERSGAPPGTIAADFVFGPGIDEPLAMRRGNNVYYYFGDGLGSVRFVTDTSNQMSTMIQNSYSWDPWGKRYGLNTNDLVASPFGYTGRESGEASQHFYRARYYLPWIGRFLAEDPRRGGAWSSIYSYTRNNPLNETDPSGLEYCDGCNCGPWNIIEMGMYDVGSRTVWGFLGANAIEIVAPDVYPQATVALGMCICYWEMAGSVRVKQPYIKWGRSRQCGDCSPPTLEVKFWLGKDKVEVPEDSIMPLPRPTMQTIGAYLEPQGCWCPEP